MEALDKVDVVVGGPRLLAGIYKSDFHDANRARLPKDSRNFELEDPGWAIHVLVYDSGFCCIA